MKFKKKKKKKMMMMMMMMMEEKEEKVSPVVDLAAPATQWAAR